MSYFKRKRKYVLVNGIELRLQFGGSSKAPDAPSVVHAEDKELADEKERIDRYNEYMKPFEDLYNLTPEYFGDYLEGMRSLYPTRQGRTEGLENALWDFLPQVNVLSPEFKEESQKRYDIRKEQGLETLGELYDPQERKITGRAFQQFGGLESSAYKDLQGKLADERAEGISTFVNQLDLQKQMEEAQQLQMQTQSMGNIMNARNLFAMAAQEYPTAIGSAAALGSGGVTTYNNLINALRSLALQRAMMENQFNLGVYQAQMQYAMSQPSMGGALLGAGASLLGALI